MALDLEDPGSFDGMRHGGRSALSMPVVGCYAISAVDGTIATSELGHRATFVCDDAPETFYALSSNASIATAELGDRATFVH